MSNVVIVGSSGHASVIVDIINVEGKYNIVGFIDDFRKVGDTTLEIPVLGSSKDLPNLIKKYTLNGIIIAIGDNFIRKKVTSEIKIISPNLNFINCIHPSAIISKNVVIREGTVVMAGSIINPSVIIGAFCILNTNSSIDHDSEMLDFSSLAPNVSTGGGCSIGELSSIGIGSTLKHGIKIGNNTVIGAGSLVLKDIENNVVSYGVPTKIIRTRKVNDRYL